ncbi:MAG: TfoX/Sxy family protein [Gemmatimonadota bacterium]
MPVTPSFRAFVEDQLERIAPSIRTRRMFGAVGIYSGELFFALIADDVLYFKVDDETRGAYEERGLRPFRPFGPDGAELSYREVPAELLDDADALRPWTEDAVEVARRAR